LETITRRRKPSLCRIIFGLSLLVVPTALQGEENPENSRPRSRYGAYNPAAKQGYRLKRIPASTSTSSDHPDPDRRPSPQDKDRARQKFLSNFGRNWFKRGASEENKDEDDQDAAEEPEFDPTAAEIRLTFFNADWGTVLNKVAEASHSVLVMDKVPPGRFSNYDREKYTRAEAVRILNEELEPKRFRLVEKGKFLVVLHLKTARVRYHRPQLPRYSPKQQKSTDPRPQPQRLQRSVHTIGRERNRNERPRRVRQASGSHGDDRSQPQRRRPSPQGGKRPSHLRTVNHRSPQQWPDASTPPQRPEELRRTPSTPAAKPVVQMISAQHRKAVDIARTIYRPLKPRAELIDAGPAGLPAFRVYEPDHQPGSRRSMPAASVSDRSRRRNRRDSSEEPHNVDSGKPPGRVLFSIGIDAGKNQLAVKAPPEQNAEVVQLIRYLDTVQVEQGKVLRIAPTRSDPTLIAMTLKPQLVYLVQNKQHNGGQNNRRNRAGASATDKTQPNGAPAPSTDKKQPAGKQPMGKQPGEGPGDVIPIIRGRVTIRDVPGVGLVVTGNKEDVDAVLRIIRELDRQGLITAPNIHVQPLRHVNSQALAELLDAVYQQLATIRSGQTDQVAGVAFIPVIRPNALLIISSKVGLPAIQQLIDELDQPVDPQKEYRVFHLKFAVASQVVANLDALFEQQDQQQQDNQGLASRVRAIADVRTNAVIIEAAPNDMQVVAQLIYKLDRERINSVNQVRIFRLKNAVATELAQLVNSAIQSVLNPATATGQAGQAGAPAAGGGQGAAELRDAKSAVLEFMVADGERKRLVRSGILSDIRVTADQRINALVVTAPEMSMELMEQLIEHLDQPSALVAEIKVFTLANGDANAMVDLLRSLFTSDQTGGQQQGQLGIQVAAADDASSGLVPLRFTVDPRTNSVIAVGGAAALQVVEAVIFRLDERDIRQRQTTVIRLRNSPATDVANAINQFLQSQRDLAQIDPNLVTNMELLEREIIVVPETVSNSLLISATPRYFEEIQRIVDRLDQAPPQVVIQALLVEVELNNTDEFGIELGFQDDVLFDRGVISNLVLGPPTTNTAPNGVQTTSQDIVSQESTPGFLFNNQQLGNNTAVRPSSVGTQGLSNFSLGRVNADLGFGGLVVSAQSSEISVLLRALAAKRTVHILSRPQITTLDNQIAQIQVGEQVPVVDGVNVTGTGVANPNIRQDNAGIILTVTPRIRPDNTIVMETVAEKSNFDGQGVPIFTDATTGNVIESPIKQITTARTTIAVPNGQTVVLGGMITKLDDTIERKVPWVGDIPVLQHLFRFDSTTTRRTELLIFLTPRIVRDDADAEIVKQVESERLHYVEQDAEEIHGPLFAVPPDEEAHMPQPLSTPRPGANPAGLGGRGNIPFFDDGSIPTTDVSPAGYQSTTSDDAQGIRRKSYRIRRQPVGRAQTQDSQTDRSASRNNDSSSRQPRKGTRKTKRLRLPWFGNK